MNAWLNIIYKMMRDGCSNETIYFYIFPVSFPDADIVPNLNHAFCYHKQLHFHWDPLAGCCHNEGFPEKRNNLFLYQAAA